MSEPGRVSCRVEGCTKTTYCSDRLCFRHAQSAAVWAKHQQMPIEQVWDSKCPAILQPVFVDRWLEQFNPAAVGRA